VFAAFQSISYTKFLKMDEWPPLDSLEDYSSFVLDESFDIFGCINFDTDPSDDPFYETIPVILQDSSIGSVDETPRCPASAVPFSENFEPSLDSLESIDSYNGAEEPFSASQSSLLPFRGLVEIDAQDKLGTGYMDELSRVEKPKAKKLKWDQSIIVFPAKADSKKTPRQRKNFAKARRKEVALTRRVGACIQCKLKKSSVSPLFYGY
jgi:hypothetical protein